jgi:hypothetical protein
MRPPTGKSDCRYPALLIVAGQLAPSFGRLQVESSPVNAIGNYVFHDPAKLLASTERSMDRISPVKLFNDPTLQKLTERWCAAMFGIGYSQHVTPCKVAVNESRHRIDVDIFMRVASRDWEFQLSEVQRPGRRRGHEYKQLARGAVGFARFVGDPAPHDGPRWLAEGAERKKAKRYSASGKLNLMLYANFPALGLKYDAVAAALLPYAEDFGSVWVLTSMHLCSVFSQPGLREIKGWAQVRPIEDYYPP